MTKSKAEKLIDRGSEHPEVARAARDISDMLIRIALGQPRYFAECVERAFPSITQKELEDLSALFALVSDYFRQKSEGEIVPQLKNEYRPVRNWGTNQDYFYLIHRLLCVLACDLDYCAENFDCWETRSAHCRADELK